MKPFDDTLDTLPEETSAEYEPLLTLLSDVTRKPAPLAPDEQAEALARVQERLRLFEEQPPQSEDVELQQVEPFTMPSQQGGKQKKPARHGSILRFLNTLAAVLVIGAIIGVSLLLFRHSAQFSGGNASQTAGSPQVYVTSTVVPGKLAFTKVMSAGGLEASISIMAGPYFLRELVAVNVTLTNYTHTTYELQGVSTANPCDSALSVNYATAGANTAHYTFPINGVMSCPPTTSQLKPGQTIITRWYIPLTDSGKVVLTEEARFLITKSTPGQGTLTTAGPSPLDGHWPSLHIDVASQIPSNRIITLHRVGSKVFVNAVNYIRPYVLYQYVVSCQDFSDSGSTASGNFMWTPTTMTISEPGCPGKNIQWTYVVGALGYAIASGSYGS